MKVHSGDVVKKFFIVLILLMVWVAFSSADSIYLKNGKKVDGEIISEGNGLIVVRVPLGGGEAITSFQVADIDRIEKKPVMKTDLSPVRALPEKNDSMADAGNTAKKSSAKKKPMDRGRYLKELSRSPYGKLKVRILSFAAMSFTSTFIKQFFLIFLLISYNKGFREDPLTLISGIRKSSTWVIVTRWAFIMLIFYFLHINTYCVFTLFTGEVLSKIYLAFMAYETLCLIPMLFFKDKYLDLLTRMSEKAPLIPKLPLLAGILFFGYILMEDVLFMVLDIWQI